MTSALIRPRSETASPASLARVRTAARRAAGWPAGRRRPQPLRSSIEAHRYERTKAGQQ